MKHIPILLRSAVAVFVAFVVILGMSGCKTRTKPAPMVIDYPQGINKADAQRAVVACFKGGLDESETSGNGIGVDAGITVNLSHSKKITQMWSIAGIGQDFVILEFEKNHVNRLYVRVTFGETSSVVTIEKSENLSESDTRIHKNVRLWLTDLQSTIKQSFNGYAAEIYLHKKS